METTIKSNRTFALVTLYDMHTTFFNKALEGISDADAHNRLNTKANHIAWLTGSLVEQRYEIANLLGLDMQQAAHELFKEGRGIQEDITYPALAGFIADWEKISPKLREALAAADDNTLDKIFEMPGMKMSYYDLITFTIYREANCIGQIALWRRLLGLSPMRYM